MTPRAGVLLVGFGAPDDQRDVPAFVAGILAGRRAAPERIAQVVHHYEAIGGGSPYNRLTRRQADALSAALARSGEALPVYVGMRNWNPYLSDVLAQMAREGIREAAAIVLAPHRSEASWDRYVRSAEDAAGAAGSEAPRLVWNEPWHGHPLFIEAVSARAREALDALSPAARSGAHLLFAAHSIPEAMAGAEEYAAGLRATASACAGALGSPSYRVCYQSRSGAPSDRWLAPSVEEAMAGAKAEGARAVVVVPAGFLCDHVEVLFDLDVEAASAARDMDLPFARAGTVGEHPSFITMLAELTRRMLTARQG